MAGKTIDCPQPGHLARFPASREVTVNHLPHLHVIWRCISRFPHDKLFTLARSADSSENSFSVSQMLLRSASRVGNFRRFLRAEKSVGTERRRDYMSRSLPDC